MGGGGGLLFVGLFIMSSHETDFFFFPRVAPWDGLFRIDFVLGGSVSSALFMPYRSYAGLTVEVM